jgi:DNA polymerase-3 subunit epsilon
VQLQLSLTLADDLYDLLLMSGEPLDFMEAARRLLALGEAPPILCREIMNTLTVEDQRFCWTSPATIGLLDWKLADPDLADVTFVVVDIETTGSRPGTSKITEIGAVRIEGLRQVGTFETLVNPQRPIPSKIIEITGITPRMVLGAPRIEQVMPHFLDFARDAVVVGHNAAFDLGFINYELARLKGRRVGDGAIDTVKLSRRMAPGLPNHRLATVAEALGSDVTGFHRALPDAQATADIFLVLIGRLQEIGITRLNQARSHIDPAQRRDRHKLALTRDIPRAPGVYLFRDEDDQVLYVGKADSLRDRVRSYFLSNVDHSRRIRQALRRLRRVDWEETGSPLEAVVREQELILEHRPPCNVFGRRPENYVYIKTARRGPGLRLYLSDRTGGAVAALGPFRGRARVAAALDLLQRCYPIRRCAGSTAGESCLFLQTGACLAPCTADEAGLAGHDALVSSLLGWIMEEKGLPSAQTPGRPSPDPPTQALALMRRLASQHRYEEAKEVRDAIEDLGAVRRSYRALAQASGLRCLVMWPLPSEETARVRVDLVWDGVLRESVSVTTADASLQVGRLVRSLAADEEVAIPGRGPVVVAQNQLDLLLAVRRWLLDTPEATVVIPPIESCSACALEAWRAQALETLLEMLSSRQ